MCLRWCALICCVVVLGSPEAEQQHRHCVETASTVNQNLVQFNSYHTTNAPFISAFVNDPGCFFLFSGWWNYELCFNRFVRQFHEEKGVVQSEFILGFAAGCATSASSTVLYTNGRHPVADKLTPEAVKELNDGRAGDFHCADFRTHGSPLLLAVEADYKLGTLCTATGAHRSTTVTLLCGVDDQLLLSFNISEVGMCQYHIFVMGSAVCKIMGHKGVAAPSKGVATPPRSPEPIEEDEPVPQLKNLKKSMPKPLLHSEDTSEFPDSMIFAV